jgi:hypothetical protein
VRGFLSRSTGPPHPPALRAGETGRVPSLCQPSPLNFVVAYFIITTNMRLAKDVIMARNFAGAGAVISAAFACWWQRPRRRRPPLRPTSPRRRSGQFSNACPMAKRSSWCRNSTACPAYGAALSRKRRICRSVRPAGTETGTRFAATKATRGGFPPTSSSGSPPRKRYRSRRPASGSSGRYSAAIRTPPFSISPASISTIRS